jgi:hypothetical protein
VAVAVVVVEEVDSKDVSAVVGKVAVVLATKTASRTSSSLIRFTEVVVVMEGRCDMIGSNENALHRDLPLLLLLLLLLSVVLVLAAVEIVSMHSAWLVSFFPASAL